MNVNSKEFAVETIEIIGKTAISLIPVGGTLITCIWDSVKANSTKRRLDDWKTEVENRLSSLEITLDDIGNNELFASAIMRATDIALKTAEGKKRVYLANAVYKSTQITIEEGMLMIYLDLLERYSVWHLQILQFFKNPGVREKSERIDYVTGSAMEILQPAFPELCQNTDLIIKIINDLQSDGLMVRGNYMNETIASNGMWASRTTQMGMEFLNYISF